MVQPLDHLWNSAVEDFLRCQQYVRTMAGRLRVIAGVFPVLGTVQNTLFVTLEMGQLAFHEAKAYTKQ